VESILQEYKHDAENYLKVSDIFNAEMDKGLSKKENKKAIIKMLITYVRNLPTGNGTYG